MKKTYVSPSVENIAFRYRDQVVAASGVAAQGELPDGEQDWGSFLWDLLSDGFTRDDIVAILRRLFS